MKWKNKDGRRTLWKQKTDKNKQLRNNLQNLEIQNIQI